MTVGQTDNGATIGYVVCRSGEQYDATYQNKGGKISRQQIPQ
jgi:hypothetical protein